MKGDEFLQDLYVNEYWQVSVWYQVKSSEEAVILCKTSIGSLKLEISDLPATKVPVILSCSSQHSSVIILIICFCLWMGLMSVKLFFNPVLIHLFKLSLLVTLSVCYQKIIEDVEEMLNNLPGVTSVHGRFYDLSSKYYRIIGNHAAYYKDALRYLGCVDIKDLPGRLKAWWEITLLPCWSTLFSSILFITYTETEKQERAFTLGLAGLLGEGVYNFGELVGSACMSIWAYARESSMNSPLHLLSQLMHPVLESLRNTDKQWLIDTLYAFNGGNVEKFQSYKSSWGQQVILSFYITTSGQHHHMGHELVNSDKRTNVSIIWRVLVSSSLFGLSWWKINHNPDFISIMLFYSYTDVCACLKVWTCGQTGARLRFGYRCLCLL